MRKAIAVVVVASMILLLWACAPVINVEDANSGYQAEYYRGRLEDCEQNPLRVIGEVGIFRKESDCERWLAELKKNNLYEQRIKPGRLPAMEQLFGTPLPTAQGPQG